MDITPDELDMAEPGLSYDDTTAYSDLPPPPPPEPAQPSLAGRIGHTKVYLISDAIASRSGKRKHEEEEQEELDEMEEDVSDPSLRDNAILLHGDPIAHLPTENIFAYATHFDAHPIGLEWIDDTTCILVFPSKLAARSGFRTLTKSFAEDPSEEGFVTSKPIPLAVWPVEKRINNSLGKDEGLKGALRMRWALTSDVKKRGANKESQFYKTYGKRAGKGEAEEDWPSGRRQSDLGEVGEAERKAQLDAELDAFLAEGDEDPPIHPPSRMRSDHIDSRGHSSHNQTPGHRDSLASRITAPLPRRSHGRHEPRTSLGDRLSEPRSRQRREREEPRAKRPRKTQEELDAELDAFLNSKD